LVQYHEAARFWHRWSRHNFTLSKKNRNPLIPSRNWTDLTIDFRISRTTKWAGAQWPGPFFRTSGYADAVCDSLGRCDGLHHWASYQCHSEFAFRQHQLSARSALSTGTIMSVDPDSVVTIPMPRNPAPVSSTGPVARPISVIRPIANFDVDTNCIGGRHKSAHARQSSKEQSKFFHRILLRIFLDGFDPALFNGCCASKIVRPEPVRPWLAQPTSRVRELDL
jgi:hypothetical protein